MIGSSRLFFGARTFTNTEPRCTRNMLASDYTKALEFCGTAITIREQVLGQEHSDTATT